MDIIRGYEDKVAPQKARGLHMIRMDCVCVTYGQSKPHATTSHTVSTLNNFLSIEPCIEFCVCTKLFHPFTASLHVDENVGIIE